MYSDEIEFNYRLYYCKNNVPMLSSSPYTRWTGGVRWLHKRSCVTETEDCSVKTGHPSYSSAPQFIFCRASPMYSRPDYRWWVLFTLEQKINAYILEQEKYWKGYKISGQGQFCIASHQKVSEKIVCSLMDQAFLSYFQLRKMFSSSVSTSTNKSNELQMKIETMRLRKSKCV